MPKPRKAFRMTLVIRPEDAPKVFEVMASVPRGRRTARVIEMLSAAVAQEDGGAVDGSAIAPGSEAATLHRIERLLQRIEPLLQAVTSGQSVPSPQPRGGAAPRGRDLNAAMRSSPSRPARSDVTEKPESAANPEEDGGGTTPPTQEELDQAQRLIDQLGLGN